MFLIRTAFWLALVILLLPANEGQQRQIFGAAEAAIKDLGTFCVRNPEVCERSKSAFQDFGEKAQDGAKALMDLIEESANGSVERQAQSSNPFRHSVFQRDTRGTLTNDDLEPSWLGAARRSGV